MTRVREPLAYDFEFLAIFAGAAKIAKFMSELGFRCGPPIELSASPEFDMKKVRLLEWIIYQPHSPTRISGVCS